MTDGCIATARAATAPITSCRCSLRHRSACPCCEGGWRSAPGNRSPSSSRTKRRPLARSASRSWPRHEALGQDADVPLTCPSCGTENPEQARFCLNCATPIGQETNREERKLATVLFADIVGSTAMASDEDPERTRRMLNRFYDAMTEEVERNGGTVEKFAGDAVMAAFGAPAALEDHAERALHAALAMHRRIRQLFGDDLALRIGVNTGEVLVGRPREGSSFVTGDVVNVAARLEQAAKAGEILAGERTVTAARGAFDFDEPTTVEAKGKPAGIVVRRVLRSISLMRPRGVGGLPSVFVGRESELEQLR